MASLPEEIAEDPDLRPKKSRNDGDRQIVDCARLIPAQTIDFRHVDSGNEDERNLCKPRMVADHCRQLKSVELRHRDVHKDDRDFIAQQLLERLTTRGGLDEILA